MSGSSRLLRLAEEKGIPIIQQEVEKIRKNIRSLPLYFPLRALFDMDGYLKKDIGPKTTKQGVMGVLNAESCIVLSPNEMPQKERSGYEYAGIATFSSNQESGLIVNVENVTDRFKNGDDGFYTNDGTVIFFVQR